MERPKKIPRGLFGGNLNFNYAGSGKPTIVPVRGKGCLTKDQ